jgi:hypothetical protein
MRRGRDLTAWRWPIVALLLGALLVYAFLATLNRFLAAGERVAAAPAELARGLERAARAFFSGDVTERFLSSIPSTEPLGAGRLEVAVATTTETVSRSDEQWAFWDLLPLGRTEVEIRVPVTWRWHLPLDDGWTATIEGQVLTVVAPAPRPSLPPAIHTDGIERRSEADWLRFDAAERLAALERELTPLLAARARDAAHRELAREPARKTVERFARLWLAREGADGETIRAIVVRFADESPDGAAAARDL